MTDPQFELPSPVEKLSGKYILDARYREHWEESSEVSIPAPMEEPIEIESVEESEVSAAEPTGTDAPMDGGEEEQTEFDIETPTNAGSAAEYEPLALGEDKKYFRIGEVSELIGVEPYVLRYWEGEFSMIRPVKSRSGQRVYTRKDVENLHYVRHLLHVEKFSLKGAKKRLLERRREANQEHNRPETLRREAQLKGLIHEVKELIHVLKTDPGSN